MSSLSPPWTDTQLVQLWMRPSFGDITVTGCEVEPGSAKGDNYLSEMHRVTVKTKQGPTHSLIIKCRMEQGKTADVMRNSSIFKKEQEMYGDTLPKLYALLKKANIDSFQNLAPACMHSCKSFLVLEDLTSSGFKMLERRKGLDLQHCMLVMRSLARSHAASVVLYQQDPASMKPYDVSFFSEPAIEKDWSKFFSGMTYTLAEEIDSWPEEWKTYSVKLRKLADGLNKRIQQITLRDESGFNVLNHGDLWTNNMMFQRHAQKVRFYDYQLAHFSTPAIDILYFITTSANYEVKVNHTHQLIEEYHKTLCETLAALGHTRNYIALEELQAELDKKMIYSLFSLIAPYAVMQCEPDCGFNFDDVLESGLNPGPKMLGENYKRTAKYLLPIFEKKGVFDDL